MAYFIVRVELVGNKKIDKPNYDELNEGMRKEGFEQWIVYNKKQWLLPHATYCLESDTVIVSGAKETARIVVESVWPYRMSLIVIKADSIDNMDWYLRSNDTE